MVKIEKQIVSENVINKRTYGYGNKKKRIVIHQTGNTKSGANAQRHADLQKNMNPREASWHIQIDDKKAIQSFPFEVKTWASGNCNQDSINIEFCVNSDANYNKVISNAVIVVKQIMKKEKISINNVIRHFDCTGKNCPEQLMRGYKGITWNDFIKMIQDSNTSKVNNKTKLKVNGKLDTTTIEELQRYFGTVIDGEISNVSLVVRALQSFLISKGYKVAQDGKWEFWTTYRLQQYFNQKPDGVISKPVSLCIMELQRRLNKGKL